MNKNLRNSGEVMVNFSRSAVEQLFPEVKQNWDMTVAWMLPFLQLFGVEKGNGLSPLARMLNSPEDLINLVEEYFERPKVDPRGRYNNRNDEDDVVHQREDLDGGENEWEIGRGSTVDDVTIDNLVAQHVCDLKSADDNGD
jgi:hypothetical protein